MTDNERLQKEIKSLIKRVAHLVRVTKRQRRQIEALRRQLNLNQQYYINVQRGKASNRRNRRG